MQEACKSVGAHANPEKPSPSPSLPTLGSRKDVIKTIHSCTVISRDIRSASNNCTTGQQNPQRG